MMNSLDDMVILAGNQPPGDGALLKRRRLFRCALVGAVGISYAVDTLLLVLFWLSGVVLAAVPLAYAVAGLGHVVVFSALHWSGLGERADDPHLMPWQVAYAIAVQIGFIAVAPTLTTYFLSIVIIYFSFGSLRMPLRQLVAAWLGATIAIAVVLSLSKAQKMSIAMPDEMTALVIWLSFSLVLLRCLMLGYYAAYLRVRMYQYNLALTAQMDRVEDQSIHDELTGALNRRALMPMVADQIHLSRRGTLRSSLLMIDIDHFKEVNDSHGHVNGDRVLQEIVAIIARGIRTTDKLARYGGEEFAVLLIDTPPEPALVTMERIREEIAAHDWGSIGLPLLQVTVSAGVTGIQPQDEIVTLVERADAALYEAKRAGRNRSVRSPI
jgi:diguanylate cyclase (GGDEF)-like protein